MYCLDIVGCMDAECAGALADADDVAPDAIELLRIALGGPMSFNFSVDQKWRIPPPIFLLPVITATHLDNFYNCH